MSNDISLTVRIPKDLNTELTKLAKELGVTKVNLLRFAIHLFLSEKPTELTFSDISSEDRFRFVFNTNQVTYNLLVKASEKYGQPINSILNSISVLALEHYSKYL